MIKLFQKFLVLIETLIAIISPTVSPIPSPAVIDQPAVAIEAVNSPELSVLPTPIILTPIVTPILTLTPAPKIEDVIVQLEELKKEIVNYVPDPTPTPVIIYVTPIPTPTPISTPLPTPTPEPVYRSIPTSVGQFVADVIELSPYALSKIDSCAEKYPLSTIRYAGVKLAYVEHKDPNINWQGIDRQTADSEIKKGQERDYWDCMDNNSFVSFVPLSVYGLTANDQNEAIFQRFLVEYLKSK